MATVLTNYDQRQWLPCMSSASLNGECGSQPKLLIYTTNLNGPIVLFKYQPIWYRSLSMYIANTIDPNGLSVCVMYQPSSPPI